MKRTLGLIVAIAVAAMVFISCPQPYDMSDSLGKQTLTYSSSPETTHTFVFAKSGKSGSYSTITSTLGFPDAASEGDYAKRAWFQISGERGTFTYDPETRELVQTITHIFDKIPGTTTSYSADYKEYSLADYYTARWGAGYTALSRTTTTSKVFTQDALLEYYVKTGTSYSTTSLFELGETANGTSYGYTDEKVTTYTPGALALSYSNHKDRIEKENGVTTRARHYRTDTSYAVHAAYELGSTDTDDAFADVWKKGKTVTFRTNQASTSLIEYEGDTAPVAPTVNAGTGIGSVGASGASPLNYYYVNKAGSSSSTTYTFCNYGGYMTFYAGSASRGLE